MNAKRQLLLDKIGQAIDMLDKYYELTQGYSCWLEESARLIREENPYGLDHFLNIYSDMDSMDRISFLSSDALETQRDVDRADVEFQQLVVEMHELAKELKKEQGEDHRV